jgi:hypothetical protein
MDPSGYYPLLLPPPLPPLNLMCFPEDDSLAEVTVGLQDLIQAFQDPSRRDALQDVALYDFQRALFDGLAIFASTGLLDRALDFDTTGAESTRVALGLYDILTR